eukprot:m.225162 g.225162  ORF g.225162 m.225162 type:complete len:78 (-) comp17040_c0_seq3:39-272(-)
MNTSLIVPLGVFLNMFVFGHEPADHDDDWAVRLGPCRRLMQVKLLAILALNVAQHLLGGLRADPSERSVSHPTPLIR